MRRSLVLEDVKAVGSVGTNRTRTLLRPGWSRDLRTVMRAVASAVLTVRYVLLLTRTTNRPASFSAADRTVRKSTGAGFRAVWP